MADQLVPATSESHVTIGEFCTRLSASDRRVELLAAFNATEVAAGRGKDSEANYASRYQSFIGKPL